MISRGHNRQGGEKAMRNYQKALAQ